MTNQQCLHVAVDVERSGLMMGDSLVTLTRFSRVTLIYTYMFL